MTPNRPEPTPADGTSPTARALRPVPVDGTVRSWSALLTMLAGHGAAVGRASVDDWAQPAGLPGDGRALLGSEAPRFHAMRDSGVRRRFAASRRLVKHLAGAALSVAPEDLDLVPDRNGRPCLDGYPWLDVNLSHTGDLLVAGFAWHRRIGVDVERSRRPVTGVRTEALICTPQERALLRGLPPERRNALLIQLWTLKEAFVKATGSGLRHPFPSIGFDLDSPEGVRLLSGVPATTATRWLFETLETHDPAGRHRVSIALAPTDVPGHAERPPATDSTDRRVLRAYHEEA